MQPKWCYFVLLFLAIRAGFVVAEPFSFAFGLLGIACD